MEKEKKAGASALVICLIIANILLLSLVGWGYFFYVPQRIALNEKAEVDDFRFLNPARHLSDAKDLIINFQPLRDELSKYETDARVSIYFEYLKTGANIAVNKDAEFYPASLLKVPVAMAVAKKIEKGEWRWSNELVLMSADKDDKFGNLHKEPTGKTFTIEELVRRSISDSDNTAHFMLVRNLEIEEMKEVYDHMGLEGFLETEGSLSAKRYSVIFRTLYSSSYLTGEDSQKLLSYLSQSPFNYYIQAGLPENVTFAHKIGTDIDKKVYLDSGIVYAKNRPYIITVMTKNNGEQEAKEIMKNVSEKAYDYVSGYSDDL